MKICICILTSAHPIDDVRVYRKIALSLVDEYEVIWIGPDTYFFENTLDNDGILRYLVKPKKGTLGRLYTIVNVIRRFRQLTKRIDFVYFPDPDLAFLFTHFVRSRHKKIFDIHEVFHKGLLKRRVKGVTYLVLKTIVQRAVKRIVRKVDLTIGVSSIVLNYYISERSQSLVIRSCLPRKFAHINGNNEKKNKTFTIVHGKNHISRGTLQVFESLRILKERGIFCKVLMINQSDNTDESIKSICNNYDIGSYIDLHDGLPFQEMLNEMSKCHAGLIAYDRDLGIDSLPNRIFEYMALGIPAIVPSFSTELANMVLKEKCGLAVDTENPAQLADVMEYLIMNPLVSEDLGKKGKEAFLKRHNWEVEVIPLIDFINNRLCSQTS